jgi:imidazole glycerol phosphate synthase glutamine amidotransferase subunit
LIRVALVDYGAGNLVSIGRALESVGAAVTLIRDAAALRGADALVVPGVGAAGPAMIRLERRALVEPIRDWVRAGRPFLGICLGLQLLFEGSDEDGSTTLGLLSGRTVSLRGARTLPHIGWNQVERRAAHPILEGIPDGADLYFVHSYVVAPSDRSVVIAETTHGSSFVSAVASEATLGVQFHPERSGVDGLRLLANFVGFAAHRARGAGGGALPAALVSGS